MKLRIDFYSKSKMGIDLDFSGRYPFPENEVNELFLFTCFALRQLSNLGGHLTAKALAGLLVSSTCASQMIRAFSLLPAGSELLSNYRFHVLSVVGESENIESSVKASMAVSQELNYPPHILEALDREILAQVPALVSYAGKGKRSFELTLPPFQLRMSGFGILGQDVNHHAFHSVVGLMHFLGQRHISSKEYLDHLVRAAHYCGSAYMFHKIPLDQPSLATAILKEIDVL